MSIVVKKKGSVSLKVDPSIQSLAKELIENTKGMKVSKELASVVKTSAATQLASEDAFNSAKATLDSVTKAKPKTVIATNLSTGESMEVIAPKSAGMAKGGLVPKEEQKMVVHVDPASGTDKTGIAVGIVHSQSKAEFKQMTSTVEKKLADGSETSVDQTFGGEMFEAPPANVSVNIGLTKNLGNYESIRFSVHLSVPTANNPADIEQAFTFAKEWVDDHINAINKEVEEGK